MEIFVAFVILAAIGAIIYALVEAHKLKKAARVESENIHEEAYKRHQNPPRIFLPQHRELMGVSVSCHGINILAKVLPGNDEAVPMEITLKIFDDDLPEKFGQFANHLVIVQGDTQPRDIRHSENPTSTKLPPGDKLVTSQLGCHNVFLTRPAVPGEILTRFELYTLNDEGTELIHVGTLEETA